MGTDIYKTTDIQNVIDYLSYELHTEKVKMLNGEENHYSYIYMICNDIGITDNQ